MHFQCHYWDRYNFINNSIDLESGKSWVSLWLVDKGYCNNVFLSGDGTLGDLWGLISDYSTRKLTFPKEYLNNILGVLRYFAQESN